MNNIAGLVLYDSAEFFHSVSVNVPKFAILGPSNKSIGNYEQSSFVCPLF